MRKKQLYAVILAGVVAAGSVPGTVFASQQDSVQAAAETIENEAAEEGTETSEVPSEPTETPDVPTEAPTEPTETPDVPTETPSEPTETPDVPTEAPAEPTETPSEPNGDAQPSPEATVTPIPGGPVETDMGVSVNLIQADGSVKPIYYATLQDAVNAALEYYQAEDHDKSKAVVVEITKQFSLSETVRIENGKINIVAAADVSIGRIDPQDPNKILDGDMFVVTGKDSELQLSAKNGGRLTLSGENGSDGAELSSGALVRVENEGSFGISDGVILSGNTSSADGAAIDSKGGSVVLKGGTITGNSGAKGAVYSNADIAVQGTVTIKDNTGANLYLDGEAAAVVTDVLNNSAISLTSSAAADQKVIAKAGSKADGTAVSADEFKAAAEQFAYDTEDYSIVLGADGLTAVLKSVVVDPQPDEPNVNDSKITGLENPLKFFPNKSYSFKVTGAGFENENPVKDDVRWKPIYWAEKEKPTDKEKQTSWRIKSVKGIKKAGTYDMYVFFKKQIYDGQEWKDTDIIEFVKTTFQSAMINGREWNDYGNFLSYQHKSIEWLDYSTVQITLSTTKDCKWYYYLVDINTKWEDVEKLYDETKLKRVQDANTKFTVKVSDFPDKDMALIIAAKPTNGNEKKLLQINLDADTTRRPNKPTVTTRAPRKYQVTESTVTGLENPLKFFPRKFYDFQVVGAGQNDKDPVSNDERWIPLYWSMSVNGTKNNSWRIGSQEKGIREAATYPLYIFFRKQTYNGKEWVDTDVIEYMKTSFSSAEITDEEWNAYIDEYNNEHPDDGLNYDGTGAGSVADLTPTEAPSSQDTGSSEKAAADTADYAPIGSMSALAALSLLAGGYVIVRKRKKEEI